MTEQKFLDRMYKLTDETGAREVAGIYDEWADTYESEIVDGLSYAMPQRASEMLPKLIADRTIEILDVGCGTGLSGVALQEAGYERIDGCDISQGMLEKAAARNLYRRLFQADVSASPIEVADESYDAITVVGAFAYGHLGAADLAELLRMLRHGGVLLLTTNDHYFEEGSLDTEITALDQSDKVILLAREHGDHMPGKGLGGWVYALGKNRY